MTIKELYDYAKTQNLEDAPILIGYGCDDDFYGFNAKSLEEADISFNEKCGVYGRKLPRKNIYIAF